MVAGARPGRFLGVAAIGVDAFLRSLPRHSQLLLGKYRSIGRCLEGSGRTMELVTGQEREEYSGSRGLGVPSGWRFAGSHVDGWVGGTCAKSPSYNLPLRAKKLPRRAKKPD